MVGRSLSRVDVPGFGPSLTGNGLERDDLDIWRAAKLLIDQPGPAAALGGSASRRRRQSTSTAHSVPRQWLLPAVRLPRPKGITKAPVRSVARQRPVFAGGQHGHHHRGTRATGPPHDLPATLVSK